MPFVITDDRQVRSHRCGCMVTYPTRECAEPHPHDEVACLLAEQERLVDRRGR
jgi:hypothetical protein